MIIEKTDMKGNCFSSESSCCSCKLSGDSEFDKILTCQVNGVIPVTKYVSKHTGLTVVHAEIEGPIVNGYIAVTTRAEDDDGLPHCLEHLVFLGSKNYPYKGVLDRLANKCLASGTNAWTDVDHTCYTLSTAGSDGFCTLLPIYLDHIFYPLLTEPAFKTEVHHVTGKGTDGGVVYSEMLSLEGSSYEKSTNELFRTLYPPESGYHYNVGGALKNLRTTCTNERVREFHKKFYHPRNACLIICGMVNIPRLFHSMMPTLRRLVHSARRTGLHDIDISIANGGGIPDKPWVTEQIPDLEKAVEKRIKFPSDDERGGFQITVGFLGPSVTSELEDLCAMFLLLRYLVSTASSPLQQAFVEKHDYLATNLNFSVLECIRTAYFFELEGVMGEDVLKIVPQLVKSLKQQVTDFDMSRMTDIIKSNILSDQSLMENHPHDTIAHKVIRDFVYSSGLTNDTLEMRLNGIQFLEEFLKKPDSFWTGLIQDKILTPKWVTIIAEPSKEYEKEVTMEETKRIQSRKEALTAKGLVSRARELDEAIMLNSRPVPKSILRKVHVPSMKSILYHNISRVQNPVWAKDFPANLYLDDIITSFVYVGVIMDTSSLSPKFRQYLQLFREVILNSAMKDPTTKEVVIPFETVSTMRYRDIVVCEMTLGLTNNGSMTSRLSCGTYSHLLSLGLQMELEKIESGMDWIRKILWCPHWELERIRVAAHKIISDIYFLKRDGAQINQVLLTDLMYKDDSNAKLSSPLLQLAFLRNLDDKLENIVNEVAAAFNAILKVITDPKNMGVHVACNLEKMKENCEDFESLLKKSFPFDKNFSFGKAKMNTKSQMVGVQDTKWMQPLREQNGQNGGSEVKQLIYGLGSDDSSYLVMVAPGPTSFQDSDVPALLTTLQYFTQLEGPLYRKVRGRGYAYSYTAMTKVSEGLVHFSLSRCSDLVSAYSAVLSTIKDHISNKSKWSDELLVSAKSSLIFECLESEKTPLSLATNSLLAYYRNVPGTFNRDLNDKIAKVKRRDLQRIVRKYLVPLFSGSYPCVVVCHTEQVDAIYDEFHKLGKELHIVET